MTQSSPEPSAEQLQELLLESPGFSEFLLSLTTLTAATLGGQEPMLCAITVERGGSPATVASSTQAARTLDERQYSLHHGPCLTALRTDTTVLVPDIRADGRWEGYADVVAGVGVTSVLAVPIPAGEDAAAALNCYARETGTFTPATVARIQDHAASMSGILRLATRLHRAAPYPEHLREALKSRAVMDAAVALIMLQNKCSRDQAMNLLSVAAQQTDAPMHAIAQDILAGASGQCAPGGTTGS